MTTATNQKPKTKSQTNQDHLPVKALASDPFDVSVWFGNDGNFSEDCLVVKIMPFKDKEA